MRAIEDTYGQAVAEAVNEQVVELGLQLEVYGFAGGRAVVRSLSSAEVWWTTGDGRVRIVQADRDADSVTVYGFGPAPAHLIDWEAVLTSIEPEVAASAVVAFAGHA